MTNPLVRLKAVLAPPSPLLVGEVTAHNGDGTSTLGLPDGGVMRARGQTVQVGHKAFVRSGAIEGEAPNLPTFNAEV
jgi:hypothetical protein